MPKWNARTAITASLPLVAGSASVAPAADAQAPGWYPLAAMSEARVDHTATLLPGGKILVAGGRLGTGRAQHAERGAL